MQGANILLTDSGDVKLGKCLSICTLYDIHVHVCVRVQEYRYMCKYKIIVDTVSCPINSKQN